MVYINSKKFACESCIKGHRSSSCHHNDRPLFEIKKKGRPVSQCEKCREARQARRLHAKCMCDTNTSIPSASSPADAAGPSAAKKGKRFIPTVPTLPNGLKDALKMADGPTSVSMTPRSQVDALLNPCNCGDVRKCKCRPQIKTDASDRPLSMTSKPPVFSSGLSALAHVAACCAPAPSLRPLAPAPPSQPTLPGFTYFGRDTYSTIRGKASERFLPSSSSGSSFTLTTPVYEAHIPPAFSQKSTASMPSTSTTASDGCCCGHRCECPECTVHNQPSSSSAGASSSSSTQQHHHEKHKNRCGHDCPTCVDHDGGVALPSASSHASTSNSSSSSTLPTTASLLDDFYARAAALPSPPSRPSAASVLDATNVVVYPPGVLGSSDEQRELAFGLVKIPKLECCGGKCSCPEGSCACGTECGGCCD